MTDGILSVLSALTYIFILLLGLGLAAAVIFSPLSANFSGNISSPWIAKKCRSIGPSGNG